MKPFNKLLLIALAVIAIGTGVGIAAATNGGSSDDPVAPTTTDVKGPCDELEHATDPSCAGAQVPEDNDAVESKQTGNGPQPIKGDAEDHADRP